MHTLVFPTATAYRNKYIHHIYHTHYILWLVLQIPHFLKSQLSCLTLPTKFLPHWDQAKSRWLSSSNGRKMQHFFTKDRTEPQNQVMAILSSFTHPSIKNWIAMNKDDLQHEDYTFEKFIIDLHKNFLDLQWISQILQNVIYAHMAETESFKSYANRIFSGNNLLARMENHLSKPILHDTIKNHLVKYLFLKNR